MGRWGAVRVWLRVVVVLGRRGLVQAGQDATLVPRQCDTQPLQLFQREAPALGQRQQPVVLEGVAVLLQAQGAQPVPHRHTRLGLGHGRWVGGCVCPSVRLVW